MDKLIDTHAHIDSVDFDEDINEVIKESFDSGLQAIIIPATEPAGFDKIVRIADANENIFFAVGVHPHNAHETAPNAMARIEQLAAHKKAVAIGEIGLDYYYDFSPKDAQIEAFSKQIDLAMKLNKPIIVHNRESDDDLIEILNEKQDGNLKSVLHCFSSDLVFLEKALNLNCMISFTGNITFKKSNLNEIVDATPLERIMIETDCPYMTPVPLRGRRNRPSLVRLVAEKIAEIKSLKIEEVIKMTANNAKEFFKLTMLIAMFALVPVLLSAQTSSKDAEFEDEEEEFIDPFPRSLGFGPVLGINTIVETYKGGLDRSYEGIASFGGLVCYRPIDYLVVEAAYLYSKNTKLSDKFDVDPTVHHVIELTSHWMPNPHNRVNFFGTLGLTSFMSSYGASRENPTTKEWERYYIDRNVIGLNTGLGFYANISLKSSGTLSIMAEWRLDFMLKKNKLDVNPSVDAVRDPVNYNKPTEISTFFSIPRASIIWFPNLGF